MQREHFRVALFGPTLLKKQALKPHYLEILWEHLGVFFTVVFFGIVKLFFFFFFE